MRRPTLNRDKISKDILAYNGNSSPTPECPAMLMIQEEGELIRELSDELALKYGIDVTDYYRDLIVNNSDCIFGSDSTLPQVWFLRLRVESPSNQFIYFDRHTFDGVESIDELETFKYMVNKFPLNEQQLGQLRNYQ